MTSEISTPPQLPCSLTPFILPSSVMQPYNPGLPRACLQMTTIFVTPITYRMMVQSSQDRKESQIQCRASIQWGSLLQEMMVKPPPHCTIETYRCQAWHLTGAALPPSVISHLGQLGMTPEARSKL